MHLGGRIDSTMFLQANCELSDSFFRLNFALLFQQQSSAEELRTEAAAASMHANMSYLSSQQAAAAYQQQQSMHHAAAGVAGQPLLLQPVPSEFIVRFNFDFPAKYFCGTDIGIGLHVCLL